MDSMRLAEAAAVSTATRASATLVMTDMGSALRCGVARLMTPLDFSGSETGMRQGRQHSRVLAFPGEFHVEPLDDCACEPAG